MSIALSSSELSSAIRRNRSRGTRAADRQIRNWREHGSAAVTAMLYQPANRKIAFIKGNREGWSLPTAFYNQEPGDDEALGALFALAARLGIRPHNITLAVPNDTCLTDGHPDRRMPIHGLVCTPVSLSTEGDSEWIKAAWLPLDSMSEHTVPAEAAKDNRILGQFALRFHRIAAA